MIQHHLATADHYDFRLEIDGVLVSWAVPKGPSLDPQVRRLAKRVDDHSMDDELYEGVISVRRRGGGTKLVWDRGTFRNVSTEKGQPIGARDAVERGHISVVLDGEKLHGGFSLIRTGDTDLWLLIKKRDAGADTRRDPVGAQPESVLTGRTLEEIFEQESGV